MDHDQLRDVLASLAAGKSDVESVLAQLRKMPFEAMDYAHVDHHRSLRCGSSEVIFCPGKTVQQVLGIATRLTTSGQRVLATRASEAQLDVLGQQFQDAVINRMARAAILSEKQAPCEIRPGEPYVTLLSAGTADMPVLEEAAMTLRFMQVPTLRITDVGVSGLHRLLAHLEAVQGSCAVVVAAGMEGALPSVVGGLVACPVYAVPTSIGYGASFGGVAALLGMLNSCASNVSVVNIDNGFGGAYCAGKVYQQIMQSRRPVDEVRA